MITWSDCSNCKVWQKWHSKWHFVMWGPCKCFHVLSWTHWRKVDLTTIGMDVLWFSQEGGHIYKMCVCGQLSWSLLILLHVVPAPSKHRLPISYMWMYGRENLLLSYLVAIKIRAWQNGGIYCLIYSTHKSHEEMWSNVKIGCDTNKTIQARTMKQYG